MIKDKLPLPMAFTALFIAVLPLGNLYAWEHFTLFNTAINHRIWITGWELVAITLLFFLTPFNFIDDIKKYPKLAWPILLLCLAGFISCFYSQNIYAALARHSEIILHFVFIYLLSKQASNTAIKHILIAGLVVSFLYTLYHFSLLRLAVGDAEYNWVSNIPFFANIRHWGYLQVLILPLSYFFILSSNNRLKFLGYGLFFLTWVSILFSGGRGSLLAGLITCFFIAPFILKPTKKVYALSIVLFLTSIFTAYQIEGNNPSLSIKRLFFIPQIESDSEFNLNRTSSSRIGIYKDAIREVFDHSPVFGMGPDNYRYSLNHQYHVIPTQPHSLPIQFIYEYGLVGTCLILLFIINLLKHGLNLTNNIQKSIWLSLLCCLAASLVDGNFYHSYSIFNACLIIAILVSKPLATERCSYKKNLKIDNTLLPVCLLPSLIIWGMHNYTFSQYLSPLKSQNQINNIQTFPSITPTNLWIIQDKNPDLFKQALFHGGVWSDGQCGHYKLLRVYYSINAIDEIKKNCRSKYQRNY